MFGLDGVLLLGSRCLLSSRLTGRCKPSLHKQKPASHKHSRANLYTSGEPVGVKDLEHGALANERRSSAKSFTRNLRIRYLLINSASFFI